MCVGPCRTLWIPLGFLFTHTTLCSIVEAGLPLFWLLSFIYLPLDSFTNGKSSFFAYYCVPRKSSTSCNNGLPTIFLGKARSEIFCTIPEWLCQWWYEFASSLFESIPWCLLGWYFWDTRLLQVCRDWVCKLKESAFLSESIWKKRESRHWDFLPFLHLLVATRHTAIHVVWKFLTTKLLRCIPPIR